MAGAILQRLLRADQRFHEAKDSGGRLGYHHILGQILFFISTNKSICRNYSFRKLIEVGHISCMQVDELLSYGVNVTVYNGQVTHYNYLEYYLSYKLIAK